MNFDYVFHEKGVSFDKDRAEEGHLWLDVGNMLDFGVIDHHSAKTYSCTVEALINNLNLIDPLKNGKLVTFHTHKFPDTDALFSIYLVQYYLNNGHLPENIKTILDYVLSVDRGNVKLAGDRITLYKVISFLNEEYKISAVLNQFIGLINNCVLKSCNYANFSFMESDISDLLSGISGFEDFKTNIQNDYQRYLSDRDNRDICDIEELFLPLSNSNSSSGSKVKALIWKKKSSCVFNRLWARDEGFVLTVVPLNDNGNFFSLNGISIPCTDINISIPPDTPYSLRPLACLLEQYEQEKEKSVLGINISQKRDHSRPRGRPEDGNRFYEDPWDMTADPWFFSSDHSLVQSPYSGSLLTSNEVIHVVKTFGECLLKSYKANIIVPFTYTPSLYKKTVKWFLADGWNDFDADINGNNIPWINNENRYINSLLEEYSFPLSTKRQFTIIKSSLFDVLRQDNPIHNICNFDTDCYSVLFEHGSGVTVFSLSFNQPDERRLASLEIEKLNDIQNNLYNNLSNKPLYNNDLLYCLSPHFYTSIEVSSECLRLSNSIINQYAELICDVFDNNTSSYSLENLNYRAVLANSRLGCAIVIVTDKHEDANPKEKHYRRLFDNEWLYMYIISLQQRYSLLEIKRSFTSLSGIGNNKSIRLLRDALIKFYATSYFTTATDDELGDNIFQKWHNIFMINDLKTDIMEQINQHDEYQNSKLSNLFSIISALLLPLVFLSTVMQTSIFNLDPLFLSGNSSFGITINIKALPSWLILYVPIFLLVAITIWYLKKKKK